MIEDSAATPVSVNNWDTVFDCDVSGLTVELGRIDSNNFENIPNAAVIDDNTKRKIDSKKLDILCEILEPTSVVSGILTKRPTVSARI